MMAASLGCVVVVVDSAPSIAQTNYGETPQTNLAPIQSPAIGTSPYGQTGTTPPAASGGYGSSIYASPNFATPPPPNTAPVSGSLFDPYASAASAPNSFAVPQYTPTAPPGTTPLGAPVPLTSTTGNAAYPNGGLLNGLFSGSMFSGGSTTAPYQGAAYQGSGFATGYGGGTAVPYDAGSIYSGAAPTYPGTGMPYAGGTVSPNSALAPPSLNPYPSAAYPSGSPSTLFPGGFSGSPSSLFPGGFSSPEAISAYQMLNGPRLRHTYIGGGDGPTEVGYNQTDASIGFAWPNFLFSTRPLFVVPSFSLYLFDGPATPASAPTRMLPSSAYAASLDFGWQTDPNQIVGAELGVRVGAYTDFDTFNSDSIRVLGKALASFRLTPTSTLKGGVYYLDRLDTKLLPAGGLLWQPNPYTRFDIYFPEPKLAKYWRTIGTRDVWWYLAGEYGGDSWTLSDTALASDGERVDINQINAMFGFEWGNSQLLQTGQRSGFIEAGISFDRELLYEQSVLGNTGLDEAFILRAGIGY
ncbi:putative signal peptide protein [Rhodopirellula islandica]|uniref:Signal peptide protein n=2 Tax=Rhodopirellula islandica TaxID=595434 RepID=A0A0J1BK93_RHOIS|nr:putative signal peptide protein [Rhodopirellula islandica]